mgnify:CR=1 FL=1
MKLSKIVDKVKKYLEKDNLKVSQEKKLLNIIEELEKKKGKIKDELKNIDKDNIKKRVELEKKYNAVSKVLKKDLAQTQTGTPYYASPEVWKD